MALLDQAAGCLLAAAAGDAMGTPSENLEYPEIERRWGWLSEVRGSGTDDTLLRDLLIRALTASDGTAGADEWAAEWLAGEREIRVERRDKFFISTLHTLEKLRRGYLARDAAEGNLPSSTSAMAIAPIGVVHAGDPTGAARHAERVAALMHGGPVAFCQDAAAAVAAAVAAALIPDPAVDECLTAAVASLPRSGVEIRDLLERAACLARSTGDYRAFREAYLNEFRRPISCDSRETVPAALALCLLAEGDPRRAVEYGANFGRDTDTIATMAGGICGALAGQDALPEQWLEGLTREAPHIRRQARALLAAAGSVARHQSAWAKQLLDRCQGLEDTGSDTAGSHRREVWD